MDYIKPAAAALIGVLGGLLLAKGVKKYCDKDKKQDGHWREMIMSFFFSSWKNKILNKSNNVS